MRLCVVAGLAATVGMSVLPATAWGSTEANALQTVSVHAVANTRQSEPEPEYKARDWFADLDRCTAAGNDGLGDGWWSVYKCEPVEKGPHKGWYLLSVVYT